MGESHKQATKVQVWLVCVTRPSLLSPASGRRPTRWRRRRGSLCTLSFLLRFFASSFLRVSRRPVHSVVVQRFLRLCPLRLHLRQRGTVNRATLRLECTLQCFESLAEFGICLTQRGFWLDAKFAGKIRDREKQVTHLFFRPLVTF